MKKCIILFLAVTVWRFYAQTMNQIWDYEFYVYTSHAITHMVHLLEKSYRTNKNQLTEKTLIYVNHHRQWSCKRKHTEFDGKEFPSSRVKIIRTYWFHKKGGLRETDENSYRTGKQSFRQKKSNENWKSVVHSTLSICRAECPQSPTASGSVRALQSPSCK